MTVETVMNLISLAMFAVAGATLASAGVGVMDKPLHFCLIMSCMVVVKTIGITQ
jgi:hypothetical protein